MGSDLDSSESDASEDDASDLEDAELRAAVLADARRTAAATAPASNLDATEDDAGVPRSTTRAEVDEEERAILCGDVDDVLGTGDASAPRDADVLLLVEVPDSDACMAAYPTWKQLAGRLGRSAPNVRVCAFSAETDAAKQWAGRHLAATSHPTFVAMPRAGGVYKFGGETATLELLKKFADEAFKKQNRRNDKNELNKSPVATHRGGRTRHPMDKPHASSEYYRGIGTTGGPVGAVVDASVQGAANVARMAAPLAIISLVVGFFMATALRILDLAFGESSASCRVGGWWVGVRRSRETRGRRRGIRRRDDVPGDAGGQPRPGHRAGRRGEAEQRRGADEAGEGTRGGEGDAGEGGAEGRGRHSVGGVGGEAD